MNREKESIPNESLRRERLQRGWSQNDVADKIGSDPKTVGRWERGETFPSFHLRQELCTLFQKTPEELGLLKEELQSRMPETAQQPMNEQGAEGLAIPYAIHEEKQRGGRKTWQLLLLGSILLFAILLLLVSVDLWSRITSASPGSICQRQHDFQSCNGQDPVNTGCTADQLTVQRTKIYDGRGYYYGDMKLERSAQCQTEWAEYTPNLEKTHHLASLTTLRCSIPQSGGACTENGGVITHQFQVPPGDYGEVRAPMAFVAPGSAAADIDIEEAGGRYVTLSTFFY